MSSRLLRPLTRRLPPTSPACLRTARSGTYSVSHINPSSYGNISTTPLRIITRPYSLYPGGMGPPKQQQRQQEDQNSDGWSLSSLEKFFLKHFTKVSLITLAAFVWVINEELLAPNDLSWSDFPVLLGLFSPPTLLNPTSFIPYTIVSREQVSSTAFILAVEPFDPVSQLLKNNNNNNNSESGHREKKKFNPAAAAVDAVKAARQRNAELVLQRAWRHGLWCVEIKQPQLQVARDYTPLPPPVGEEKEEMERGRLRFLIRKMDGGEVSSYLSRLNVGDKVELRGPHLGFDVAKRLGGLRTVDRDDGGEGGQHGQQGQVVFLAGGTGIAPALQVARRLYGPVYEKGTAKEEKEWKQVVEDMPTQPPKMTIVWANRFREDCPDCEGLEALRRRGYLPPSPASSSSSAGGIMPYLQDIKAHHPEQFNYACTVDTEKKFVEAKGILDAVASTTPKFSASTAISKSTTTTNPSCPLHSPSALIHISDRQDHDAKCRCASHASTGKNLLMVSGPDGFIARFAGPKAWSEGLERQGHVGGVAGELMRNGKMSREEWMVLKL
ncbi:hypothetical protein QBC32DRAFT_331861 [Pseudoneurospora amorphoporcata]|uniref:FAD-binding FR-type domain-containing protein n=1 Tax=Pseudoneurospora amorphoporcata TaxID=241081 RepID=A0AAN6SJL6_9PEZI|nr:hypothetical protein QBC32DRAFT_331861 [Pseudoneurospora amorphoporcata]